MKKIIVPNYTYVVKKIRRKKSIGDWLKKEKRLVNDQESNVKN